MTEKGRETKRRIKDHFINMVFDLLQDDQDFAQLSMDQQGEVCVQLGERLASRVSQAIIGC